jgi:hypothetical protein
MQEYLLSDQKEESTHPWMMQIIPDKIRVKDEPFESLFTVFNKNDARIFIKTFNSLQQRYFNYYGPMCYRSYHQNGVVCYEIYLHRWCVMKNDELIECNETMYNKEDHQNFMKEVNRKLGEVYCI